MHPRNLPTSKTSNPVLRPLRQLSPSARVPQIRLVWRVQTVESANKSRFKNLERQAPLRPLSVHQRVHQGCRVAQQDRGGNRRNSKDSAQLVRPKSNCAQWKESNFPSQVDSGRVEAEPVQQLPETRDFKGGPVV